MRRFIATVERTSPVDAIVRHHLTRRGFAALRQLNEIAEVMQ